MFTIFNMFKDLDIELSTTKILDVCRQGAKGTKDDKLRFGNYVVSSEITDIFALDANMVEVPYVRLKSGNIKEVRRFCSTMRNLGTIIGHSKRTLCGISNKYPNILGLIKFCEIDYKHKRVSVEYLRVRDISKVLMNKTTNMVECSYSQNIFDIKFPLAEIEMPQTRFLSTIMPYDSREEYLRNCGNLKTDGVFKDSIGADVSPSNFVIYSVDGIHPFIAEYCGYYTPKVGLKINKHVFKVFIYKDGQYIGYLMDELTEKRISASCIKISEEIMSRKNLTTHIEEKLDNE